jgi:hypothetical protein
MSTETKSPAGPKWMFWTGWVLSGVLSLLFAFSGVMKLTKSPDVVEGFTHLGWPDKLALTIGAVELACTILYLIPQTAVLGAILFTGYMGGAIATHVRIGEPVWLHVVIGVVIWLGLYLRDPRLRALIPLRSPT